MEQTQEAQTPTETKPMESKKSLLEIRQEQLEKKRAAHAALSHKQRNDKVRNRKLNKVQKQSRKMNRGRG